MILPFWPFWRLSTSYVSSPEKDYHTLRIKSSFPVMKQKIKNASLMRKRTDRDVIDSENVWRRSLIQGQLDSQMDQTTSQRLDSCFREHDFTAGIIGDSCAFYWYLKYSSFRKLIRKLLQKLVIGILSNKVGEKKIQRKMFGNFLFQAWVFRARGTIGMSVSIVVVSALSLFACAQSNSFVQCACW